jgi:hypothetical protein
LPPLIAASRDDVTGIGVREAGFRRCNPASTFLRRHNHLVPLRNVFRLLRYFRLDGGEKLGRVPGAGEMLVQFGWMEKIEQVATHLFNIFDSIERRRQTRRAIDLARTVDHTEVQPRFGTVSI